MRPLKTFFRLDEFFLKPGQEEALHRRGKALRANAEQIFLSLPSEGILSEGWFLSPDSQYCYCFVEREEQPPEASRRLVEGLALESTRQLEPLYTFTNRDNETPTTELQLSRMPIKPEKLSEAIDKFKGVRLRAAELVATMREEKVFSEGAFVSPEGMRYVILEAEDIGKALAVLMNSLQTKKHPIDVELSEMLELYCDIEKRQKLALLFHTSNRGNQFAACA